MKYKFFLFHFIPWLYFVTKYKETYYYYNLKNTKNNIVELHFEINTQ